jgi:hypothetical protein
VKIDGLTENLIWQAIEEGFMRGREWLIGKRGSNVGDRAI